MIDGRDLPLEDSLGFDADVDDAAGEALLPVADLDDSLGVGDDDDGGATVGEARLLVSDSNGS